MKKKSSRKRGASNRSCAEPAGSPSYKPFGKEWRAMVMRMPKSDIIDMLRCAALAKDAALSAVPTNWTDPLLSGPESALKGVGGQWGCPEIERLCNGIKERIRRGANNPALQ